jgi:hypothetical protein
MSPAPRLLVVLGAALLLSGCGVPPELQPKPGVPVPSPTVSKSAVGLPSGFSLPPSIQPSSPGLFPDTVTATCGGRPTSEQVIALVRRTSSILPSSGTVTTLSGPLCAGSWQYTVLQVPEREPLQVVTKGAPTSLALVTAGTDICTVEVRSYAPPGIRLAARC